MTITTYNKYEIFVESLLDDLIQRTCFPYLMKCEKQLYSSPLHAIIDTCIVHGFSIQIASCVFFFLNNKIDWWYDPKAFSQSLEQLNMKALFGKEILKFGKLKIFLNMGFLYTLLGLIWNKAARCLLLTIKQFNNKTFYLKKANYVLYRHIVIIENA